MFCHLAFADQVDVSKITLPVEAPPFDVPDVLIHRTTARAAKVPSASWKQVISMLGLSVGLVAAHRLRGAYNAGDAEEGLLRATALIDLRGRTSLIELAGACQLPRR